ncbi:MAG: GGDEF domain-containing protein [Ruminococcus sp.]|nr:GGDEF domain-containing protein [Ruminococcus sp.]
MTARQRKKRLKLKKARVWGPFILFLLMSVFLTAIIAISVSAFIQYALDSKLSGIVDTGTKMVTAIDEGGSKDALSAYSANYFITDKDNSITELVGVNTCETKDGDTLRSSEHGNLKYKLYSDTESESILDETDEDLGLNLRSLFGYIESYLKDHDSINFFTTNISTETNGVSPLIDIPVWISMDIGDSGRTLYYKGTVSININYVFSMIKIIAAIAIIYLIVFILMLINLIVNVIAQKKMRRRLLTDEITGGGNRLFFFYKSGQILCKRSNAKKRYAVLSIEFVKYLNYCVCHSIAEGDALLRGINSAILSQLGKKDIVSRFDSADFAVLINVADENDLNTRTDKLLSLLEDVSDDHKLDFHIGIYMIGAEQDKSSGGIKRKYIDPEECYNNARTARNVLLDNDSSGKAMFDEKLVEEQKWIDAVLEHQQAALEREEFAVYYQPKYDPRTNTLRGAEALIRWQSPELGFITPYRFIPIFEKNGFITEIDHYMLAHAARDQKRWLDQGKSCVPISVNISRAHFIEEDLAEQIRDIIDAEGAPHELIELELTESAFFDDKKMMIETISRLKSYGFTISMDDFGSGYSSLNSLKDMPLDVLKLDAEFFRGESQDGRDRIVVAEAIRLARSLNMRTVAEGVEVKEQVDFLAEQECDMIQGYYYAKPMPRDEFEERLS